MPMPIPTISPAGLAIPTYNQCLSGLQTDYFGIYGADAQLGPNDLDGQLLAIFAQGYFDLCQVLQNIYNSFSPLSAQGAFLDNIVALDGITRTTATASTATLTIVGQVGITITNGQVGDNLGLGTVWNLPASVTIPSGGTINVLATCTTLGAIPAAIATLTNILTPTAGWQTVNNSAIATPGLAVITDAQLQQNQQAALALGSLTYIQSIVSAVLQVSGVTGVEYINNVTDATNAQGIPRHTFALIVTGGTTANIATAIALTKPPGIGTYGNTSYIYTDTNGVPETIYYTPTVNQELQVVVTIKALTGWVPSTATTIQNAVQQWITSLVTGQNSYIAWIEAAASLQGTGLNGSFVVTGVTQALFSGVQANADLINNYYTDFYCNLADVTIVIT